MDKLESITARLERAVERLEKFEGAPVATRSVPAAAPAPSAPAPRPAKQDVVACSITSGSGAPPASSLEDVINTQLKAFLEVAQAIGGEVLTASAIVQRAFEALRALVSIASQSKKPDDATLQQLIQPLANELTAAAKLTEGRRTDAFNHYKAIAEALQAFSFVVYSGPACGMSPPAQMVAECWQSAEFWGNKISMQHRSSTTAAGAEMGAKHVEWVKGLKDVFKQLQSYVAANHKDGLRWNPSGGLATDAKPTAPPAGSTPVPTPPPAVPKPTPPPAPEPAPAPKPAPAPVAAPSAPPPPPPPPSVAKYQQELLESGPEPEPKAAAAPGSGGGIADVFAELSKGEAVTAGLRKVTADMKTKNRTDRTGAVPATTAKPPAATPSKAAGVPKGDPKVELQQKKWVVEYQSGNKEVVLDSTQPQQSVYIYGCVDTVVQVKGKVNSISLDACKRTGVVFSDVIASVEAVNCSSCQVQVLATAPTLAADKCDGLQLYIPKAIAKDPDQGGIQVVTAKCSEINVIVVPDTAEGEAAEPEEMPIPEQFISTFKGGKLVTMAAVHSGA